MVPPISHLAVRIGGIDNPDERKVHCTVTPRLGGIAVFCAFLFSVLFFFDIDRQIKAFLAGGVIIFLTGLADDLICLRPRYKFLGEIFAALTAIISGGISMKTLGNPLGLGEMQLGILAIPFTVFAVVGVMNAINLIDGLDGLAGGVSSIACIAFGVLSWKTGNMHLLALLVALVGAIAGFLRYNTYPAKIFMGDSGSLFLGYCMGFFAVLLLSESRGLVSPVAPLMILGVPVLDTLVVMGRRINLGKKVFNPDKTHIHHRLLNLGLDHKFSVILVYSLSYLLAALAIFYYDARDTVLATILVAFCATLYIALYVMTRRDRSQNFGLLLSSQAVYETHAYRTIVGYSHLMLRAIKYLLILILTLSVFIGPAYPRPIPVIAGLLVVLTLGIFLFRKQWGNTILQAAIYFSGVVSIFVLENYGRQMDLFGCCNLVWISHGLFIALFVAEAVKISLRRRKGTLISTPFEYFILFIVVAIPLLPTELTATYHILSVAAKSVILFIAYKLILIRQTQKNRKILVATSVALMAIVVRYMIHS